MPTIRLQNLWTDEDSMLQPEITLSNDNFTVTQDFFAYPADLREFADGLQLFPSDRDHTVIFEYGSDPNYYCHLFLRAIVINSVGHSALEVKSDNRLAPPIAAAGHFFLACNPSTINSLGVSIAQWAEHPEGVFEHHWSDA